MSSKKKGFSSAADEFMSVNLNQVVENKEEVNEVEEPVKEESVMVKDVKSGKERKSKKVLLALTPSLYNKISEMAEEEGLTFSAYVTYCLNKVAKG